MKMHVYISDPIDFAKGQFDWCLTLLGKKLDHTSWIYAGEIDIEIDVDRQSVVLAAQKELDEQEQKIRKEATEQLARIEQARAELLALPHLEAVK